MRLVRERVDDERIVHIVGLILDRAVTNRRTAPDNRGRGLHQGSVLAPMLSNLYLDTFDRRMLAAGYRVIRYADLCRHRHKSHYAECRIMPNGRVNVLVSRG